MDAKKQLYNILNEHLNDAKNRIAVVQDKNKLIKKNARVLKYSWSKSDILNISSSVETFIESLPNYGFTNGAQLLLQRTEGSRARTHEEVILKFANTEQTTEAQTPKIEPVNTQQHMEDSPKTTHTPPQNMAAPVVHGMGYAQVPHHDLVSMKVKNERYEDLLEKHRKAEKALDKCEADLQLEKLKRFEAERKLETITEKKDFERERALAGKETALDKLANNEAIVNGLGAFLGKIPDMMNKQPQPQMGMGNPIANFSESKKHFIKQLETTPDQVVPLLQNSLWAILNNDEFAVQLQQTLSEILPKEE